MIQRLILAAGGLVLVLVLAIWLEHTEPSLWQQRLILPNFAAEENRHTPLESTSEYLPPTITASRTISAHENPIVIAGPVIIPTGVTLTLEAGTHILVHEYGSLQVAGSLDIRGLNGAPVVFSTNEAHEANRVWSGIIFEPGSTGTISHASIRHSSPSVTCEPGSTVSILDSTFEWGNTGVVTYSPTCTIARSTIRYVDIGIVTFVEPSLRNMTIQAREKDIQYSSSESLPAGQ